MFDGNVGKRTRVSMGGKKTTTKEQSKHEFIAAAREERVQRAQQRLFHVKSVKIQSWYRGCHSRSKIRFECQQSVISKCNDIIALQQVYSFVVPIPVLTRLVQETLFSESLWNSNPNIPSCILQFVQEGWSILQQDIATNPIQQEIWSLRIATLSSLVSIHSPSRLKFIVPNLLKNLPKSLYFWAIRPKDCLFQALFSAWQNEKEVYEIMAPLAWSITESYSLHGKLAKIILSMAQSGHEPTLKIWVDSSWPHLPASTEWVSSIENQITVVGNLLEILENERASDQLIELIILYTNELTIEIGLKNLKNFGKSSILLKLFNYFKKIKKICQIYSWIILKLNNNNHSFLLLIYFTILNNKNIFNYLYQNLLKKKKNYFKFSSIWFIFTTTYSYHLETTDDQNLLNHFPHLPDFVLHLNQVLYGICWQGDGSPPSPPLVAQVDRMIELFNQLYIRDSRLQFCTGDAWLWPSFMISNDIIDLNDDEILNKKNILYEKNEIKKKKIILFQIPQVILFEKRIELFHYFLNNEKKNILNRFLFENYLNISIQRNNIVEDSFLKFENIFLLKNKIKITFINEQGLEEAGVDGGGVFKEYMDTLTKKAFSIDYPYFLSTENYFLYPNSILNHEKYFKFLGRVLAKAMYEEILIEPQFALFFLKKLLGHENTVDDLQSLDTELYRHLIQLKKYNSIDTLGLTFSIVTKPSK